MLPVLWRHALVKHREMDKRMEPLQDAAKRAVEAPSDIGTGTTVNKPYRVAFLDQELCSIDSGLTAADH